MWPDGTNYGQKIPKRTMLCDLNTILPEELSFSPGAVLRGALSSEIVIVFPFFESLSHQSKLYHLNSFIVLVDHRSSS